VEKEVLGMGQRRYKIKEGEPFAFLSETIRLKMSTKAKAMQSVLTNVT
jgi:hypothetical protein